MMGMGSSKQESGKSGEATRRNDVQVRRDGKQVQVVKYYGPKETAKEEFLAPLNLSNVNDTGMPRR